MVECDSIEQAREVPGVVMVEASNPVRAWLAGDKLPSHLVIEPSPAPQEDDAAAI